MYCPPTLLQRWQIRPTASKTAPSIPFYRTPPAVRPPDAREPSTPTTHVQMTMPPERREEYKEFLTSLRLSDKFHILGLTREARYVAYCLAGTAGIQPPQLLAHSARHIAKWGQEGREIVVHGWEGALPPREVAMPLYTGKREGVSRFSRLPLIDNLIITVPDGVILSCLIQLRDAINENTTILLLNEGLGTVEHLNEVLFPDPSTRPTYVLGYMDHLLSRHSQDLLSMDLKKEGKLHLSIVKGEATNDQPWSELTGRPKVENFVKLLMSAPGLNAGLRSTPWFLRYKLPEMVFKATTDAVSVVLGCHYDRIWNNPEALALWHKMVDETVDIVCSLPELQDHPDIYGYFTTRSFKYKLYNQLKNQKGASKWIAMLRKGRVLPTRYLNRWFIKRAEETGVNHATHSMVMSTVKARQRAKWEELSGHIPMYKYMVDRELTSPEVERDTEPIRYVYLNKSH